MGGVEPFGGVTVWTCQVQIPGPRQCPDEVHALASCRQAFLCLLSSKVRGMGASISSWSSSAQRAQIVFMSAFDEHRETVFENNSLSKYQDDVTWRYAP